MYKSPKNAQQLQPTKFRSKMNIAHNIKSILILVLLCQGIQTITAQQDPHYIFYNSIRNVVNPAFTGTDGTSFSGNIHSQWSNVKGAPETQSFAFGTAVGKKVGLGLSLVNDQTFIEKQTAFALDFSYGLPINEETKLYFGLKAGMRSFKVNTAGLVTYGLGSDPSLTNLDGRLMPTVGAGLYWKHSKYYLALSVPQILSSERLEQEDDLARLSDSKTHLYFMGGFDFLMGSDWVFKPATIIRYVDAAPLSVDIRMMSEFKERIGLGVSYRNKASISGMFVFKTNGALEFGYAYSVDTDSDIRQTNNGSHEIMMQLKW